MSKIVLITLSLFILSACTMSMSLKDELGIRKEEVKQKP